MMVESLVVCSVAMKVAYSADSLVDMKAAKMVDMKAVS